MEAKAPSIPPRLAGAFPLFGLDGSAASSSASNLSFSAFFAAASRFLASAASLFDPA